MRRRDLIVLLGGAALLHAAVGRAQEPGRVYRLMAPTQRDTAAYVAFFDELRRQTPDDAITVLDDGTNNTLQATYWTLDTV